MRLLVVEDDAGLRSVLERGLTKHGYVVDTAERGADADLFLQLNAYAAAVIDWRLPDLEGTDLIRRARARGDRTPILMLTARDLGEDRIAGLDAGADDYLVKPFDVGELLARLRALMRRPPLATTPVLRCGDLTIDPASRAVTAGRRPVELTRLEFALLEVLVRRAPAVVPRGSLAESIWPDGDAISGNALAAQVARLRAKITGSHVAITAVRGVGYRAVAT
ncbi:MAG: response regulator transcription factor [Candidatus Dormibacteria bacterium]